MTNNNSFFTANGITSTSANHIANLAKEAYQAIEKEVEGLNPYSATISLVGTNTKNQYKVGSTDNDLMSIIDKTKKIVKLKTLIAWLREAIKAKESKLEEAKHLSNEEKEELLSSNNITLLEEPELPVYPTEEDIIQNMPIKQRFEYIHLETKCAQLGKLIHNSGPLASARVKLNKIKACPIELSGTGRDALVIEYNPSIKEDKLEELFFTIQNKHREAQASLNAVKQQIKDKVVLAEQEARTTFNTAYDNYRKQQVIINNLEKQAILNKTEQASKLKINIPDNLKDIYKEISELGKK